MAETVPALILSVFLLFCRIGACLMVLPGVGSARVPTQVRLFLAFGVTLALAPGLVPLVLPVVRAEGETDFLALVAVEVVVGLLIGTVGRSLLAALQALATATNSFLGIAAMPGAPVEDTEAAPALVTLITLFSVLLLFLTDLHLEILRGLWASYATVPVGTGYPAGSGLDWLVDRISQAFLTALQVTSPYMLYGFLVNLGTGLVNKMMPALPVFFIAQPFVMLGGFILLMTTLGAVVAVYGEVFSAWLAFG
ncbi:flagellar biosynthetic protein FliR [Chthonobacter rhizosphaerae]|uniref:flagellar biosynthetic protein FliR n=1 Tax=Chthonobacter rhizosphaerae TaxID=2735553 RepID=UPI0015EFC793|nr:flagellar biosynthetic protein FliR [Chthonobacter rhizosphaerae]